MFENLEILFGIKAEEKEIEPPKNLPVYMASRREMFRVNFDGNCFFVICVPKADTFGVLALKKQLAKYEECFGGSVAYSFSDLTKIQRDSLMKHQIPFFALPNQIYLPFLGIMLRDKFTKEKNISLSKMMPATQCLYLYLLSRDGESVTKMEAADALGLTRMSITRASAQLEGMGLIDQVNIGKNVFMKPKTYGIKAYELAKPYLINPIKKTILVKGDKNLDTLPLSGESALSSYSMLNEPEIPTKAICKGSSLISDLIETDDKWAPEYPCVRLQLWKYDPSLFSKNGMVDKLSLALSFMDTSDERIEDAVHAMMEESL